MALYPVNLDIHDKLCVVIGGGKVALRKVESLLSCRARVKLVSPELCRELQGMVDEERIEWQAKFYERKDIQEAFLVFAATDRSEVQKLVAEDADRASLLVNVADSPIDCSFQVPASHRQGELLVAISTGGASPALATRIRKKIAKLYGDEYGLLVELLADIRQRVLEMSDSCQENKQLFETLASGDLETFIRGKNWQALKKKLLEILPAEIEVSQLVTRIQESGKRNQ